MKKIPFCSHGCLKKMTEDKGGIIAFDLTHTMFYIKSSDRMYFIRYCPQCGEKIDYDKKNKIEDQTLKEVNSLTSNIHDVHDLLEILGKPDRIIPENSKYNVKEAYEYSHAHNLCTLYFTISEDLKTSLSILPKDASMFSEEMN